jgi:hypothetical protein
MKVTAKMECNQSSTLELESVLVGEQINKLLGFIQYHCKIININTNVFIDIAIPMHPNLRFGLGGPETHCTETISKLLIPPKSRSVEAIKCLKNHKSLAFKFSKLGMCNNVNKLQGFGFQIGIANIG